MIFYLAKLYSSRTWIWPPEKNCELVEIFNWIPASGVSKEKTVGIGDINHWWVTKKTNVIHFICLRSAGVGDAKQWITVNIAKRNLQFFCETIQIPQNTNKTTAVLAQLLPSRKTNNSALIAYSCLTMSNDTPPSRVNWFLPLTSTHKQMPIVRIGTTISWTM